jgi:hypothetical protein
MRIIATKRSESKNDQHRLKTKEKQKKKNIAVQILRVCFGAHYGLK